MQVYLEILDLFRVLNTISHSSLHDILLNTRNKYGISARLCIILYINRPAKALENKITVE